MAIEDGVQSKPKMMSAAASHFLASLAGARKFESPFRHWLLENVLPEPMIDAIASLPIPPPVNALFNGTREINNSSRLFFSPDIQERCRACRDVACAFDDARVVDAVQAMTGSPVAQGLLRIEYCQDVTGFWLEPHLDISVKLFTMLIYLSDDPALRDAGTDIYDDSAEHRLVATVPYEKGKGLIFVPGRDTWHGFSPRPIAGVRKSLIVNFVAPEWRATDELA